MTIYGLLMMEYSENNTDWPSSELTLCNENVTLNIIDNGLNQNADDKERYVGRYDQYHLSTYSLHFWYNG